MSYEFSHDYQRNDSDYYVEPRWCIRSLIEKVNFNGSIHDPACGGGTIPKEFIEKGFLASGADKKDRGYGITIDFFKDTNVYENIVSNPPYRLSEEFIKKGLRSANERVAILARIAFLNGQRRFKLYTERPPEKVVILSRRPSMPPGGMNIIPQGGKTDFCWIVWNNKYTGPTQIVWSL